MRLEQTRLSSTPHRNGMCRRSGHRLRPCERVTEERNRRFCERQSANGTSRGWPTRFFACAAAERRCCGAMTFVEVPVFVVAVRCQTGQESHATLRSQGAWPRFSFRYRAPRRSSSVHEIAQSLTTILDGTCPRVAAWMFPPSCPLPSCVLPFSVLPLVTARPSTDPFFFDPFLFSSDDANEPRDGVRTGHCEEGATLRGQGDDRLFSCRFHMKRSRGTLPMLYPQLRGLVAGPHAMGSRCLLRAAILRAKIERTRVHVRNVPSKSNRPSIPSWLITAHRRKFVSFLIGCLFWDRIEHVR